MRSPWSHRGPDDIPGRAADRVPGVIRRAGSGVPRARPAISPRPPGPGQRRRRGGVDPFCALEVQCALSRVEAEIVALTTQDDNRFARGHHLIAARLAFDQLLDEACRLAEVADLPAPGPLRRMVAEAELRLRGWTW
jgi:hypothetical protein